MFSSLVTAMIFCDDLKYETLLQRVLLFGGVYPIYTILYIALVGGLHDSFGGSGSDFEPATRAVAVSLRSVHAGFISGRAWKCLKQAADGCEYPSNTARQESKYSVC